jgi:hypothetical protein
MHTGSLGLVVASCCTHCCEMACGPAGLHEVILHCDLPKGGWVTCGRYQYACTTGYSQQLPPAALLYGHHGALLHRAVFDPCLPVADAAADPLQVNVGKGGAWLFPYLLERYGLAPEQTCIIGDRLDTDIAMGREGGLVTLLPLTGAPWNRRGGDGGRREGHVTLYCHEAL